MSDIYVLDSGRLTADEDEEQTKRPLSCITPNIVAKVQHIELI